MRVIINRSGLFYYLFRILTADFRVLKILLSNNLSRSLTSAQDILNLQMFMTRIRNADVIKGEGIEMLMERGRGSKISKKSS